SPRADVFPTSIHSSAGRCRSGRVCDRLATALRNLQSGVEANGARWPSRSSKSVAPRSRGEARFDSEALPPDLARPSGELRFGKPAGSPRRRSLSRRSTRSVQRRTSLALRASFVSASQRAHLAGEVCHAEARAACEGGLRSPFGRASSRQASELTSQ